jgi:hypothetical protein
LIEGGDVVRDAALKQALAPGVSHAFVFAGPTKTGRLVRALDSSPYLAPPNREPAVEGRVVAHFKLADQRAFLEEVGRVSC